MARFVTQAVRYECDLIGDLGTELVFPQKMMTQGVVANMPIYESVSKKFRTFRPELELQMVQLSLGAIVSLFCK
jgi:hypothetical protein